MNARTLNRRLKRGRALAMTHEEDLIIEYSRLLRRMALDISEAFRQQATSHLTAGATPTDPPSWTPPPEGDIMGGPSVRAAASVRPIQTKMLQAAVTGGLAGVAFDVTAPMNQRLLDQLGKRAEGIEGGFRQAVATSIAQSFDEGLSIPDAASALLTATELITVSQAVMLARTDLIGLANGGSSIAVDAVNASAAEAGEPMFLTKSWLATMDDRTRETHVEADGQEVPIDATFTVGEDQLDYPGDPEGSDAEVINCRCTVLYDEAPSSDSAGGDELAASASNLGDTMNFTSGSTTTNNSLSAGSVTITIDDASVEASQAAVPTAWKAVLALEGVPTIDGRYFPLDSLTWRDLPLSLLAQTETAPGHDGAEVCGRIDRIWRVQTGADTADIMGAGEFTGEEGCEIAAMVADQSLTGLSVDVAVGSTALRDPSTGQIVSDDSIDFMDLLLGTNAYQTVMYDGVIGAATVCAFPAFDDAKIAVVATAGQWSHDDRPHRMVKVTTNTKIELIAEALSASAAGMAPMCPPGEWFQDPALDRLTALTVTDEGRIVGYLAGWDTCHIGSPGGQGTCTVAPDSKSDYRYFHLGELTTAEGDDISVGNITLDTGHAGLGASRRSSLNHYDHTGTVVGDVRVGEDAFGIWVAGAVRPEATPTSIRKLRSSSLSGDWRTIDGHLELIAALCVNVPGFPIPRAQAAISASGVTAIVAAGIVVAASVCPECGATVPMGADECPACGMKMKMSAFAAVTCPNCGAENVDGAEVCADCGQKMPGADGMSFARMADMMGAMAAFVGIE